MTKFLVPVAATLFLTIGVANANPITTSNQAVSACKTHLKNNVDGYKRAKVSDVRSSRANHKITFRVKSESGNVKTKCVVDKADGSIALSN